MSTADPFEEFEFKPLTEGLGFHKKAEKIKTEIRSLNLGHEKAARAIPEAPSRSFLGTSMSATGVAPQADAASVSNDFARPATKSISDLIASLPPSLDFLDEKAIGAETDAKPMASALTSKKMEFEEALSARPQIFQPLARDEYKAPATVLPTPGTKASAYVDTKAPAASHYRDRIDQSLARAFPHMERAPKTNLALGLEKVSAAPMAAFLDAMVAAGVATIALVSILAITHINLMGLLTNAQTDVPTQIHLGLLFIAVLLMYMLVARSFFGASLGEWAFDLQLGSKEDQSRIVYPLLVAWRSIIVTATGLVVLPALSLLVRRDLIRYLTGLQLYRRTN